MEGHNTSIHCQHSRFLQTRKGSPNTDLRFLGDFLEPLYVTAVVFWVFAFYLSRLSMGIEEPWLSQGRWR